MDMGQAEGVENQQLPTPRPSPRRPAALRFRTAAAGSFLAAASAAGLGAAAAAPARAAESSPVSAPAPCPSALPEPDVERAESAAERLGGVRTDLANAVEWGSVTQLQADRFYAQVQARIERGL
ncbi:hypothetical protein MUK71_13110 [Arthrobacter zhangbolii]|uniref:Uncharacterized protein n=1 Tax=Arthrobacter zhangbolii TaxID=2886936 RepID=A0ABY4DIR3_9MICC|nr:hypothetical protein [Arthrobacter zhangbolii]UON91520.1 hypothetical protein MUK71_13110 [Arthrobacter zhangbolii]